MQTRRGLAAAIRRASSRGSKAGGWFRRGSFTLRKRTGASYTSYEDDYSAAGHLRAQTLFGIGGQPYSSYEVAYDTDGQVRSQTLNNKDGTHAVEGFDDGITLTSTSGNDTITGNGTSETFVFKAGFAHDTITDFASHLCSQLT